MNSQYKQAELHTQLDAIYNSKIGLQKKSAFQE